ncbi:MAG TPA: hypothetical protein VGV15_15325, partial [Terriglobales bacterium]|nr:hypothetical protein [Terriglobales bacterium]
RRQQIELLENEADVFTAKQDPLVGRQAASVTSEQFHLAVVWIQQAGDHGQERGLATTTRANNEGKFPQPGLEVDAAQCLDARAIAEVLMHAVAGNRNGLVF